MNYYNPYFYSYPYFQVMPRTGLLSRIFGNINFNSILSGTQKTLNIVNQGIPLIRQFKPIMKNTKTLFKVMNEFKKIEKNENTPIINLENKKTEYENNVPTFFA